MRELGVSKVDEIDPKLFAECLDIKVVASPLPGFDGCLLRIGSFGTIIYNSATRHEGRIRFTISHELGHWFLHPNQSQAFLCTEDNIARYRGSPMEVEANAFAGALLMPRALLGRRFQAGNQLLATILSTAEEFHVSVMAATKRFLDLIPTPSMAIFSDGEAVKWSWSSFGAKDVFLKSGTDIDPDSTAYGCTDSSATALRIGPIENSGENWFPDDFKRERITVSEQSFLLYEDIVMTFMTVSVG